MGISQDMKQVWAQWNGQFCFTRTCPEPRAAVTSQVLELDAPLHQVQVGDASGRTVAGLRTDQIHDQERAPVYQREARLPSLEDLVSFPQNRERRLIAAHLADEVQRGTLSKEAYDVACSYLLRVAARMNALFTGKLDRW